MRMGFLRGEMWIAMIELLSNSCLGEMLEQNDYCTLYMDLSLVPSFFNYASAFVEQVRIAKWHIIYSDL